MRCVLLMKTLNALKQRNAMQKRLRKRNKWNRTDLPWRACTTKRRNKMPDADSYKPKRTRATSRKFRIRKI